ncbi:hypothetical protein B0J14DRAFT_664688 [Halenospora varia]|nr:hypothetical protein B0J14DRAFT_664688 [Halenospora varia]
MQQRGPGVYGVITEFVIRTFSTLAAVLGSIQLDASVNTIETIEAAWNAVALISSNLPHYIDRGFPGTTFVATGSLAAWFAPGAPTPAIGPVVVASLNDFNITAEPINATVLLIIDMIKKKYGINLVFQKNSAGMPVGDYGIQSSRLLSKETLESPVLTLDQKIKDVMIPQQEAAGSAFVLTMTAGPGVANVLLSRRGSALPAWKSSYVHAIVSTAFVDDKLPPAQAFAGARAWLNDNTERKWDALQLDVGAYFHESNKFTGNWQTRS